MLYNCNGRDGFGHTSCLVQWMGSSKTQVILSRYYSDLLLLTSIKSKNTLNIFCSDRKRSFTYWKKLNLFKSTMILNKLQRDSLGSYMPRFFTVFGFLWVMGVIGAIRLQHVVSIADYATLCVIVICGGINLITPIHFAGNIPKEGRMLITSLKCSHAARMTPTERKILRKNAISLQLDLNVIVLLVHCNLIERIGIE
jgi:hypothetical protein